MIKPELSYAADENRKNRKEAIFSYLVDENGHMYDLKKEDEIVRCVDCRRNILEILGMFKCDRFQNFLYGNDYCSRGERW